MSNSIFTIGYEGTTVDAFVATLVDAGVRCLVDVRAVPLSRKPGFSKRSLAAAVEEAGIRYLHLQRLGTPAEGRAAARKGDTEALRDIYFEHLEEPEAVLQMQQLEELVRETPSCLLCFERDPAECHRSLILERLDLSGFHVEHLFADGGKHHG